MSLELWQKDLIRELQDEEFAEMYFADCDSEEQALINAMGDRTKELESKNKSLESRKIDLEQELFIAQGFLLEVNKKLKEAEDILRQIVGSIAKEGIITTDYGIYKKAQDYFNKE